VWASFSGVSSKTDMPAGRIAQKTASDLPEMAEND
jgi:hypothetical protein